LRRSCIDPTVGFLLKGRDVLMSAVLLVPLLPLLTALFLVVGGDHVSRARAKIAAWPIAAAFC